MTELELLELLIKTESELQMILLDIHFAKDDKEKYVALSRKNDIDDKIELVKIELRDIKDKTESQNSKSGVINQFNHYIEQINLARQGARLTRNQGMILENMLFGYISMDIYRQVSEKSFGAHIPAYLHYTYDKENSVSIPELTEFLRNEIRIVKDIDDVDYVKLMAYFIGFKERVHGKFMS
ncbi:hypothetical protein GGR22_002908 [Flavobacterium gossypii]|uniref:DUF892 family protein n=1 Tax=Flavobacterium gossypii TaxID=1646119 RepID=A0ABR6DV51_9FLAO|nr:hypothetical protein [Flavobacterium gossypii]MBA9074735.1 hypothetical protein [Flavobacterium gossypii]